MATSEIDLPSFVSAAVLDDSVELSSRQLRVIGPRQAILNNIPFVIPFDNRVSILREYIANDRRREGIDNEWQMAVASASIRRKYVFDDGYAHLNALGEIGVSIGPNTRREEMTHSCYVLGSKLKHKIAITFVNEQGMIEAGIDGGGRSLCAAISMM